MNEEAEEEIVTLRQVVETGARGILIGQLRVDARGRMQFSDGSTGGSAAAVAATAGAVRELVAEAAAGDGAEAGGSEAAAVVVVAVAAVAAVAEAVAVAAAARVDAAHFLHAHKRLWRFGAGAKSVAALFARARANSGAHFARLHWLQPPVSLAALRALRPRARVSLVAEAVAKSALVRIHASRFFFVLLRFDHAPLSRALQQQFGITSLKSFIMFEQKFSDDASIPPLQQIEFLYNSILVRQQYLFENILTKQIKFSSKLPLPLDPKSNIQKVFVYDYSTSKIHYLDQNTVDSYVSTQADDSNVPQFLPSNNDKQQSSDYCANLISYSGIITKISSIDAGKYILDDKHELYLTYYPSLSYHQIEPFLIPGTEIVLHNIHLVLHERVDLDLFGTQSSPRRAVFVACLMSTLEISRISSTFAQSSKSSQSSQSTQSTQSTQLSHSFHSSQSKNVEDSVPDFVAVHDPKKRAQLKLKWTGLNICDLILLDDLFTVLMEYSNRVHSQIDELNAHKYDREAAVFSACKEILSCSPGYTDWPAHASAPRLSAVLCHDTDCTVATQRYTHPFFTSVDTLIGTPGGAVHEYASAIIQEQHQQRQIGGYRGFSGGDQNSSSREPVQYREFSHDEVGAGFLLGKLEYVDGAIRFCGACSSAPIVVSINDDGSTAGGALATSDLKGWVVVRKFSVVVETLGWTYDTRTDSQTPVMITYLKFSAADCLFEHRFLPNRTGASSHLPTPVGAAGEKTEANIKNMVLRIDSVSAGTLDIGADGVLGVKGRLTCAAWIVGDPLTHISQLGDPVENVICEISGASMKFWPFIDVGGYYLANRIRCRVFNDDAESVEKVTCMICSLTTTSTLVKISTEIPTALTAEYTLDLSTNIPIFFNNFLPPTELAVHTVSSLLEQFAYKPAIHGFHPNLVTLRGVVVAKSLAPSAATSSSAQLLHERMPALDLFTRLNVGTGRHDRTLVLAIADPGSGSGLGGSGVVSVYVDARTRVYDLGVVPGAAVELRRVAVKTAAGGSRGGARAHGVYCVAVCESSVRVLGTRDWAAEGVAAATAVVAAPPPRVLLLHIYSLPRPRRAAAAEAKCIVTHIEEVRLWAACGSCGARAGLSEIGWCACARARRRRIDTEGVSEVDAAMRVDATAKIYVDDGTCEATVLLETFEAVCGLLFGAGRPVVRVRLEKAVFGAAGKDVVYYESPTWFLEDENGNRRSDATVAANEVGEAAQNADNDDGFHVATAMLHNLAQNVSLNSDILLTFKVLNTFSGQENTQDAAGVLLDDFDIDWNRDQDVFYSCLGVQDLMKRRVKLSEGAFVDVLTPPRLVLLGLQIDPVKALSENHRLINS